MSPILEIRDLKVEFETDDGPLVAVRGLDLDVERGGCLGVVGESGCGKSISMLAAMGLLPQGASATGQVSLDGEDYWDVEQGTGDMVMVFQDSMSSLDPLMRIGIQVAEILHYRRGMSWRRAKAEVPSHLERVGLRDPKRVAKQYPFELSGGMRQRVMLATALAAEPRVLIADESTTGLDVTVQSQIIDLLTELRESLDLSVIFISHDLGVISNVSDSVAVIYGGRVVEHGRTKDVMLNPMHPYTRGLVGSYPLMGTSRERFDTITGSPPKLGEFDGGCSFRNRCAHATGICEAQPAVYPIGDDRTVECHRYGDEW